MAGLLAALGVWGTRVLGIMGFISSVIDMFQSGMSVKNFAIGVISAGITMAKGWNVTGGTVPNPTAAMGTLPPHVLTPDTPLVDAKAPNVPLPKSS